MPIYGSTRHSPCGRKIKKKKAKGVAYKKYVAPEFTPMESAPTTPDYQREAEQYRSVPDSDGTCINAAPEKKLYTGTLVVGISCLHKSNAVPVINQEEIIDIARMRR